MSEFDMKALTIDQLPKWLLCIPLVVQWLWLSSRYLSLTLPSVVNPNIENGGLAGESKLSYFQHIDKKFQPWCARTFRVGPGDSVDNVKSQSGLTFPLIAKPDIGWCGFGVRRINNAKELNLYAQQFPGGEQFLLQEFAHQPFEAGLFYIRQPNEVRGKVTAITIRHIPHVLGDGNNPVLKLLNGNPKLLAQYQAVFSPTELLRIPALNEIVALTTVASLRVGGRYEDASRLITPELSNIVDDICQSMGDFYWGRLDVKFLSPDELCCGQFTIIEINGAGAEAIHLWDPTLSIGDAFRGVFEKQRNLFALGATLKEKGHKAIGIKKLALAYMKQQRLISRYPLSN